MALETWNGRTASQTDADSPLDTTLMDGLRKDIDHIRQALYGSTDPSFHTPVWGHDHDGTNSKLVVLASQTAGDYLLVENRDERITSPVAQTTYMKLKEIKIGVGGTFRIKFSLHFEPGDANNAYGRVYRNGVAVGTERSNSSDTYIEYSEDIGGWSPGDLIQIYAKVNVNYYAYVKDFLIYTAAPPIAGALLNY